jgi:hypothetical protein
MESIPCQTLIRPPPRPPPPTIPRCHDVDGESVGPVFDRVRASLRYAVGLGSYLRHTWRLEEARGSIEPRLAAREDAFLTLLERGIYAAPKNPYRRLLRHFGIDLPEVRRMVRADGLEQALGRLYDAGVYVTLEEFKGRQPILRDRIEIPVKASDFDNPFLAAHYAGRTSGSRGAGSRILIDLDFLDHESAHLYCFLAAHGAQDRPVAVWRGTPPGTDGLRAVLRYARIGGCPSDGSRRAARLSTPMAQGPRCSRRTR